MNSLEGTQHSMVAVRLGVGFIGEVPFSELSLIAHCFSQDIKEEVADVYGDASTYLKENALNTRKGGCKVIPEVGVRERGPICERVHRAGSGLHAASGRTTCRP